MKHFLLIVALLVGYSSLGQTVKLYFPNDTNNINTRGAVINKGDTLDVEIFADGSGNTSARALYFDFEYTNTALQLLGVTHTAPGVTIPANAQVSMNFQDYPGYNWVSTQSNNAPQSSRPALPKRKKK